MYTVLVPIIGVTVTKDVNDEEKDNEGGSKVFTYRVPNRDVKLIEFFTELDIANGVVKSGSEWAYRTLLAAAKQRLTEMTPEAIQEEAKSRHDEIEADTTRRLALYNSFIEPAN